MRSGEVHYPEMGSLYSAVRLFKLLEDKSVEGTRFLVIKGYW